METRQQETPVLSPQQLRIHSLNSEAWRINRSEPLRGIELANEALQLSRTQQFAEGEAHALAALGACHVWIGEYESSVKYLLEALKKANLLALPLLEARVLYHLFCTFYYLSDYDNALRYCLDSLQKAKESGEVNDIANALNGIGTVYYTTQENHKSIEALTEALDYARRGGDKQIEAKILDGIGDAYLNLDDTDKAFEYKSRAHKIGLEIGFEFMISYALDGLGEVYLRKNDPESGLACYEESLRIRRKIGFKAGIAESFLHIANAWLGIGKLESAVCYLEDAAQLGEELESPATLAKVHLSFSELYEKTGDVKLFAEHLRKHYTYQEQANSKKNTQKQRTIEMQFRMESVEAEKKLLEEKNKELQSVSHDVILLSEMGQEITSLLSVESINKTVYEHLSEIMEVSGFGIGVSDDEKNTLTFPGYIEDGEIFESVSYTADDPHRLASVCYSQAKEILIGSNEEVAQYTGKQSAPVAGRPVESIIYLPLKLDNKKVGVITVQSFNKNVYTEYHLNLLRNLGVYAAIALQNAGMYGRLEQIVEERSQEILRQKEEIERSYYNTQLLSEIGQQITSNLQLDKIFRMLYDNVNKLMPAECFGVRIYHHDRQEIEYKFEIEKGIQDTAPFAVSMANDDNYSVWCVKNRQVIFLNDNQNEYHKYTSKIVVPTGEMPHSLIFYPMMIGEKVIGVITVQSFKKFAYSNYHIDILKTLGTYTAIALENASLYENLEEKVMERTMEVVKKKEEVERSYENTRLLSEIGKEISSTLDINEIIQRVYHRIDKLMDAAAFGIGIYRQEHNDLYHPCVMENGEKLPPFSFLLDQDRIASRCFKENREFVINNWMEEYTKYVKTDVPPVEGENPVSLIYIPLVSRYKTMGVLSVQSFQANAYSDYHLDIVRNLSVYIANSLENASLYESLELRVEERTEEITKAYENTRLLGQISKDISSSLSIETIIEKVYRNVNTLMDAASFGIGIFQPETRALVFPGFIEKGDKLDGVVMHIDDDRIASWCFKNQREVVINNHFEEYKKYVKTILQPVAGKTSASIIYLPLFSKENIIGVITVQSYELNAYSDYQVNMLRQLSHNVAIAIENASLYESLEDKVRERTAEVVKQKEVIEEKNKHITDSIVYAKRIQRAILPPEDVFKAHLRNSFVLYKPKDIVSGDFYWLEKKGNKILFAVVDCTGHGVPGAFMSIIGYNGLNQIVNEYHITQPAEILNRLNKIITGTLRQQAHESKIRDGMDISVCSIDLDQNKLEYAGANNPIFILRNQEVIEVRADKKPIGNFVGEEEFSFTNKELDLFPNDRLYLFSDGYADQFGGPHGKKLKYNTFRQLLIDHYHRPMDEQKVILDRMFEAWRGDLEQIDDVCVIGVAV